MTNIKARLTKSVALLAATFTFCTTGFGAIVYDNSTNLLGSFYSPNQNGIQFGDQVFLAGSDRRITDFSFDYFASTNLSGNETAQVFFYLNNGVDGAPGDAPIFSSLPFDIDAGGGRITIPALGVTLTNSSFTWAVSFSGLDVFLGENAGLLLADPPTIGASLNDFWVRGSDGSWSTFLIDGGATPGNFSARITAVPEPGTFAMIGLGILALAGYRGYRRR